MVEPLPEPGFLAELKRRRVFRVAAVYVVAGLGVLQAADLILPALGAPGWMMRGLVILAILGLPLAVVLAWAFDLTPEGVRREAGGSRGPARLIALGGLTASVAVLGFFAYRAVGDREAEGGLVASAATVDPSIAVLPFTNLSANAENEYFSDGITDDVLTALSKIGGLRVIGRSSVMRYKKTEKSPSEIGAELGVAHVLVGSVRRNGNQVRINAQLVRAGRDEDVWAESYDRELADIFAVQSEIARAIAGALETRLSVNEGERIAKPPTESLEAYDAFMRGRAEYLKYSYASVEPAISHFRRAIALDPKFGAATALLSRTYTVSALPRAERQDSAVRIARRAIALDPTSPEGYSALGEAYRSSGRYPEAIAQYRRALEIDPNHDGSVAEMAQTLGTVGGIGKLDQALPWAEKAVSLNPGDAWYHTLLGDIYRHFGDLSRAEQHFEQGLRIDPEYDTNRSYLIVLALQRHDTSSARAQGARLLGKAPTPVRTAAIADLYARGDLPEARRLAESLPDSIDRFPPATRASTYWLRGKQAEASRAARQAEVKVRDEIAQGNRSADLELALVKLGGIRGDREAVLDHLELYASKGGLDVALLTRWAYLATLRDDPRFMVQIAQMRAEIAAQRSRIAQRRRA